MEPERRREFDEIVEAVMGRVREELGPDVEEDLVRITVEKILGLQWAYDTLGGDGVAMALAFERVQLKRLLGWVEIVAPYLNRGLRTTEEIIQALTEEDLERLQEWMRSADGGEG